MDNILGRVEDRGGDEFALCLERRESGCNMQRAKFFVAETHFEASHLVRDRHGIVFQSVVTKSSFSRSSFHFSHCTEEREGSASFLEGLGEIPRFDGERGSQETGIVRHAFRAIWCFNPRSE